MNKSRYPAYATVALAGAAIAIWAGLPPTLLLVFLICPFMLFFMMGGMSSGNTRSQRRQEDDHLYPTSRSGGLPPAGMRRPLDGSHERIDNP
ncbi:MAG: hypothetical protein QOG52_2759 [Frankiaceae bacterium]|jgi:hypothetical protein|nr:hypothetical protein [Frankiaceae bacterium]